MLPVQLYQYPQYIKQSLEQILHVQIYIYMQKKFILFLPDFVVRCTGNICKVAVTRWEDICKCCFTRCRTRIRIQKIRNTNSIFLTLCQNWFSPNMRCHQSHDERNSLSENTAMSARELPPLTVTRRVLWEFIWIYLTIDKSLITNLENNMYMHNY